MTRRSPGLGPMAPTLFGAARSSRQVKPSVKPLKTELWVGQAWRLTKGLDGSVSSGLN